MKILHQMIILPSIFQSYSTPYVYKLFIFSAFISSFTTILIQFFMPEMPLSQDTCNKISLNKKFNNIFPFTDITLTYVLPNSVLE